MSGGRERDGARVGLVCRASDACAEARSGALSRAPCVSSQAGRRRGVWADPPARARGKKKKTGGGARAGRVG